MSSVHITDCALNFYQVSVGKPLRGDDPAFFRLKAKARESRRPLTRETSFLPNTPLDKAICALIERWEADEAAEEAEAGDVA